MEGCNGTDGPALPTSTSTFFFIPSCRGLRFTCNRESLIFGIVKFRDWDYITISPLQNQQLLLCYLFLLHFAAVWLKPIPSVCSTISKPAVINTEWIRELHIWPLPLAAQWSKRRFAVTECGCFKTLCIPECPRINTNHIFIQRFITSLQNGGDLFFRKNNPGTGSSRWHQTLWELLIFTSRMLGLYKGYGAGSVRPNCSILALAMFSWPGRSIMVTFNIGENNRCWQWSICRCCRQYIIFNTVFVYISSIQREMLRRKIMHNANQLFDMR